MPIVVIISDRENTHKLTLNKGEFTLGRSSSCHVSIKDPMVSGKHCSVSLNDEDRVIVKDLNSSNGTYLNGNKITETSIYIDDEVTIGDVRLWIDPNSLTAQERTNFAERATQKTKLKFINMREPTNSQVDIDSPQASRSTSEVTDDDIDLSGLHPDMQLSEPNIKVKANKLKISRHANGEARAAKEIKTKNDEKEKTSIGGKLKGLFKK